MEEKNISLEQLENISTSQGEELSQIINNGVEVEDVEGSKIGKFKDAKALLEAYNALQSDYTRKCQALSQLQKESQDKEQNSPEALKRKWEEQLKNFFEKNEKAKIYEKEIVSIVNTDKDIANSNFPLDNAWHKFLEENFLDKNTLAKDNSFLQEYIFCNEDIKQKVLQDYFLNLNSFKSPTLIASQRGSKTFLTPPNKPKTIKEAGKLVENMFS